MKVLLIVILFVSVLAKDFYNGTGKAITDEMATNILRTLQKASLLYPGQDQKQLPYIKAYLDTTYSTTWNVLFTTNGYYADDKYFLNISDSNEWWISWNGINKYERSGKSYFMFRNSVPYKQSERFNYTLSQDVSFGNWTSEEITLMYTLIRRVYLGDPAEKSVINLRSELLDWIGDYTWNILVQKSTSLGVTSLPDIGVFFCKNNKYVYIPFVDNAKYIYQLVFVCVTE